MRILIIEDDTLILNALNKVLKQNYTVDIATDGVTGLKYVYTNEYDAILLDLNLPDRDGLTICAEIRNENIKTPVIITGRVSVTDKVNLLDAGADDYITKPFSHDELHARLRSNIRKSYESVSSSIIKVGDLHMDLSKREVRRGDTYIRLRRKEFDLLELMMTNSGKILSRQTIMDHVWDMNETLWTNAIDVHIKYLRDKIDRPFDAKSIRTVHGIGYKMDKSFTR